MMTLMAEFKTNTFAGLTNCEREKDIFQNPRDIEVAEDAVRWVKKIFSKGTEPMVTFGSVMKMLLMFLQRIVGLV